MLWKSDVRLIWLILQIITEDYEAFETELLGYDPREPGNESNIIDMLNYFDDNIQVQYPFGFDDYTFNVVDNWSPTRWVFVRNTAIDFFEDRIPGLNINMGQLTVIIAKLWAGPPTTFEEQHNDTEPAAYQEYLNLVHGSTEDGKQFYEQEV